MLLNYFVYVAGFLASGVFGGDDCRYSLEVLLLQDGTSSFDDMVNAMTQSIGTLVDNLNREFGEVKLGVSSFADKPIPSLGYGPYGGYQNRVIYDYCYKNHANLTTDTAALVAGLGDLHKKMGGGGDTPEAAYEGLMRAALDPNLGWSPASQTHSQSGLPIARILMMVTDDIPHMPGDSVYGINTWNAGPHNNGWGSNNGKVWGWINSQLHTEYGELVALFAKDSLTPAEQTRRDELSDLLGPQHFDSLTPNPGTFDSPCDKVDYPSLDQVAKALKDAKITPLVLTAMPPYAGGISKPCAAIGMAPSAECLAQIYKTDLTKAGLPTVITAPITVDTSAMYASVVKQISETVDRLCMVPTIPPGGIIGEPTTTEHEPIAAGPPIGLISGATAGAIAGAAVVAGLLWKKFGMGAIKQGTEGNDGVEQANVAEETIDREGVQNIEASMFQ